VTGVQGLTGLIGGTGIQGVTGLVGGTGIQGETGIQGITGLIGDTGIQGVTGLIGGTGIQGVTGLVGETGIQGVTGLIGDTGIQGVTGLQGETGIQGVTGLIGETGIQGETGITAATGIQGVTGIYGATGIQGVTGLQGETGIQGVTGIYGETGIQGVTGLVGGTGIQGVTGFYGQTGIQGETGISLGETGIQGVTGETGIQGVTGILGLDGETGIQGVTGFCGQTGISGVTGIQGLTGLVGIGETGIQGLGETGIQGVTGISGGGSGTVGVTGSYPGSITGMVYGYMTTTDVGYTGIVFGIKNSDDEKTTSIMMWTADGVHGSTDQHIWGAVGANRNEISAIGSSYPASMLIRIGLDRLPNGATVNDATIFLRTRYDGGDAQVWSARQLKRNWGIDKTDSGPAENPATQGQATYSRSFDFNGGGGDTGWAGTYFSITGDASPQCGQISIGTVLTETWYGIPCTQAVKNWCESGQPNYGLVVWLDTTGEHDTYFYAADGLDSSAPYLLVNYTISGYNTYYPAYVEEQPTTRWVDATTLTYDSSTFSDGSNLVSFMGGGWSNGHLTIGNSHLWVDALGRLRIKDIWPHSDTDGTVVGSQT
jgi:hypothetical protein